MKEEHIPTLVREALRGVYPPGEAQAVGRMLLEEGFGMRPIDVYTDKVKQFSADESVRLRQMLQRLRAHEPIQYVLGHARFDGLTLAVGPGVLIPRPETAELVQWAAAEVQARARVLDVGTGSGCIALALAHRLPEARVAACDLSPAALATAHANAVRLGLQVNFFRCDLFEAAFAGSDEPQPYYDLIISNPPYVLDSERAGMDANVLNFEPHEALFVPNTDPLRYYRALIRLSVRRMRSGGVLMVEINRRYGRELTEMFRSAGLRAVELRRDAYGNDRMLKGVCP